MGSPLVVFCGNPVRERDDMRYSARFNSSLCQSCGSEYDVVGAHIGAGEDLIIALCAVCRADQEEHPGPAWWIWHVLGVVVGEGLTDPGLFNLVKDMARRQHADWRNLIPVDYFYARPSPGESLMAYKFVGTKEYNCQLPGEPLGTLVEGREIKLSGRLGNTIYSYTLESIAPESREAIERGI